MVVKCGWIWALFDGETPEEWKNAGVVSGAWITAGECDLPEDHDGDHSCTAYGATVTREQR